MRQRFATHPACLTVFQPQAFHKRLFMQVLLCCGASKSPRGWIALGAARMVRRTCEAHAGGGEGKEKGRERLGTPLQSDQGIGICVCGSSGFSCHPNGCQDAVKYFLIGRRCRKLQLDDPAPGVHRHRVTSSNG